MTLEERVAFLEGRVGEQANTGDGIRDAVAKVDVRLLQFEERVDRRFEGVERRFEAIDARFVRLDDNLTRYFIWIVGIQVSLLIAIFVD